MEGARVVAIVAPLVGSDNGTVGVIAALISWEWAREVESAVLDQKLSLDTTLREQGIEMFVLSQSFLPYLSPKGVTLDASKPVDLPAVKKALESGKRVATQTWDGEEYLVGVSNSAGYLDYKGLGWKAVLRQKRTASLAPIRSMQLLLGLLGGASALVIIALSWFTVVYIFKPIFLVIQSADNIMNAVYDEQLRQVDIRSSNSSVELTQSPPSSPNLQRARSSLSGPASKIKRDDEVGILFESLVNLVEALDQEQRLRLINETLEENVKERTLQLLDTSRRLQSEITEKRIVEAILTNILPRSVCGKSLSFIPLILAVRLKNGQTTISDKIDDVTIFFSDIVGVSCPRFVEPSSSPQSRPPSPLWR